VASPDLLIRPLDKTDDRSGFRSGDPDLDRFFLRYAGQNQFRHHIGTTYIAVISGRIVGFVTISPGEVTAQTIQPAVHARLPRYPLPIIRLSRLAVDERYQGQGIGKALLRAALELAVELRDSFGCTGVVVDAKPDALGFYRRLGFVDLPPVIGALGDRPEPLPMFLPIRQAVKAMEG
jgi:GNAT superfamily N-acetyltransferase